MKIKSVLIIMAIIPAAWGYVFTTSTYGDYVSWPKTRKSLSLQVNPSNNDSLDAIEISGIVSEATAQWNENSSLKMSSQINYSAPSAGTNNIYFTSSPSAYMGFGVVAVTQVSYKQYTGEIVEADIVINDYGFYFDNSSSSKFYLGNVITHELGHVLGLGHSEVKNATMFYVLGRGLYSLESDDLCGIQAVYPQASLASISGKVVGGTDIVGVFGAHVQAISAASGDVVAGAYSDSDGSFTLSGLPTSDTYYLYVSPIKVVEALPNYYSTRRDDFCEQESRYRGSFFQSCSSQRRGYPQGIKLASGNVNVGNVSIGCNLAVPNNYLSNNSLALSGVGDAFVGYFSANRVSNSDSDTIYIDLTSYDSSLGEQYLDLKLLSQRLYSPLQFSVQLWRSEELVYESAATFPLDHDQRPLLDGSIRSLLSSNPEDNYFTLKITPYNLVSGGDGVDEFDYFPDDYFQEAADFLDTLGFYFLIYNISQRSGDNYEIVAQKEYGAISDNTYCAAGVNVISVNPSKLSHPNVLSVAKENDPLAVSCGSIGNGDDSSGPLNTLFGLGLVLVIMRFMGLLRSKKALGLPTI